MFGTNKRISIIQTTNAVTDSGSVDNDVEEVLASNVPASIQAHVLNNLPPAGDRNTPAGIYYLREFRCWIPCAAIPTLIPHTKWIIKNEVTEERFRVRAVVDDAGRGHHWVLRLENYDG